MTNKTYPIKTNLSSDSSIIVHQEISHVHQMNYKKCPTGYIDSAVNTLKTRVTWHRFAFNHGKMKQPLVMHADSHKEIFEELYNKH